MKAFTENAFVSAFKKNAIAGPFYAPKVWVLPNEGKQWESEEKGMNQEELAYDQKLAEIAKLNIFGPIDDDEENSSSANDWAGRERS